MFDSSDPRSQLANTSQTPVGTGDIAEPETVLFDDGTDGKESVDGAKLQAARGQNFLVRYVEMAADAVLEWSEDRGYVLIFEPVIGDLATVTVTAHGQKAVLSERGIIVVPSGLSRITTSSPTVVIAVLDTIGKEETEAANEDFYSRPHPRVTRLPEDSPAITVLRAYPLSDYPAEQGRFGTIFRTHTLMINFLDDQVGPRDTEKLSPHHHDDFEQGSLTIRGAWKHHIRTPWTTRMSQWREDVHTSVEGPSLTIIPPPTIHTSRATGQGANLMIDLFSPPRDDFADKGWVVNAEDFPL